MNNKIKFILYIVFVCACGIIFSNKVYAATICSYKNNNSFNIDILSGTLEFGPTFKFTYDNTPYSVNHIYNYSSSSEYSQIVDTDFTSQNKCPKYVLIALKNYHSIAQGMNDWIIIFYDDMTDLESGKDKLQSEWNNEYDVLHTLWSDSAITENNQELVENGNIMQLLDKDKEALENAINEYETNGCGNADIYDNESESHDTNLVVDCSSLKVSISGLVQSMQNDYDTAIDGGATESELAEYKTILDKASNIISTHNNIVDGAPGSNPDNRIDLGAEFKCEDLRDTETYKWIKDIFFLIQIIVPIMLLVLGSIDFIRAVAAQKDDDMKKVQSTFIKRLIIAVAIFLMPAILNLIFSFLTDTFNITTCGIGGGDTQVETNN